MIATLQAHGSKRLFDSELLTVTDHRCSIPLSGHVIEGQPARHHMLFTRAGAFMRHSIVGSWKTLADPTQVHLLNAGESLQVSHVGGAHDWTMFSFRSDVVSNLIASDTAPVCAARPFANTHATVSPNMLLAYQRIRGALLPAGKRDLSGALCVEEEAITLLREVLAFSRCSSHSETKRLYSLKQRNMAESAKVIMASAPGRPHRLDHLAAELGVSPSHLAHVFRGVVGMSLHKYLLYLRMAVALDQIREGETNLSHLALDLGFSTHSHFTAAFRDCFGIPPSEVRKRRASRATSSVGVTTL
jgi:AraC family transcriptional regulator